MSEHEHRQNTSRTSHAPPGVGWLIPVGFVALAGVMYIGSDKVDIPIEAGRTVDRTELTAGPRRKALADPAQLIVEGLPQDCKGCHQIFESQHASGEVPNFHKDIQLAHGMNNRCVNCHDPKDREQLTLRDGTRVMFAQTPMLCAQCHGTVYRDWQKGTHGKTLGSWRVGSPEQHRLVCNECHNPHSPKYDAYAPLPGPNTLRMGEQESDPPHDEGRKRSPLRRFLQNAEQEQNESTNSTGGHP